LGKWRWGAGNLTNSKRLPFIPWWPRKIKMEVKRLSLAGQDQKEHIVALVALVAGLYVSSCFS
jgi:hypothetical protein